MISKRLDTLQAGRGLAALSVLLYHANLVLMLPKYLGYEAAPFFRAGNSGVSFFFVLSGFVILLAHTKDLGRPAMLKQFAWKRFRRVYPPLWIVLLLITPVFFLFPSFGTGGERSLSTIIPAFLILPFGTDQLLKPEWTLRREVLFYLMFAVLIWNRYAGCLLIALWCAASLVVPSFYPDNSLAVWLSKDNALFGVGMLACLAFQRGIVGVPGAWVLTLLGFLMFAAMWQILRLTPAGSDNIDFLSGVGAAMLVLGVVSLERSGRIRTPGWLTFLGESSYAIYLVHLPVLSFTAKAFTHSRLRGSGLSCYVFVALLALAFGIAFHLWVERPIVALLSRERRPSALAANL